MALHLLSLVATASAAALAKNSLPCDIYEFGETPCVAAHSTTRALYANYGGPLYQVVRDSDGSTTNINTKSRGGIADSGWQDTWCAGTTCGISMIYDQSPRGNHLSRAPPGGFKGPELNGTDNIASAVGAPVLLNGNRVYGVFVSPGTGYRREEVNGTAVGDEPQGIYAVFDGTHTNNQCCFDYGNAETNALDTGNGHMETIYFGDINGMGNGKGNGPWIMADLENGLWAGSKEGNDPGVPSVPFRFVTAVVKGEPNHWSIRGANAASDRAMSTYFEGERPKNGYNPMKREGAIILGIGGDNSDWSQGTFYEGCMTEGYPDDSIEDAVQANIASAGYDIAPLMDGPKVSVGSTISFRAGTSGNNYLAHDPHAGNISIHTVTNGNSADEKKAASWRVRTGLGNAGCLSFESVDRAGTFIRHSGFKLQADKNDGTKLFREDATYCAMQGFSGEGTNSFRNWGYAARYFRVYNGFVYTASNGGPREFDTKVNWNNDASWTVVDGFAS